jgi:hypothetical protein
MAYRDLCNVRNLTAKPGEVILVQVMPGVDTKPK